MTRDAMPRSLLVVLLGGIMVLVVLLLTPKTTGVADEVWIDQLTGFVLLQKSIVQGGASYPYEPVGTFDPYVVQLVLVRNVFRSGDQHGTYLAMNRLMDMLEAREGGIGDEAADAIWGYCYRVTPAAYHDVSRHLKVRDRAHLERLKKTQAASSPVL